MFETGVLGKGVFPSTDLHLRHVTVAKADATTCTRSAADDAPESMMSAADGGDSFITGRQGSQEGYLRGLALSSSSPSTPAELRQSSSPSHSIQTGQYSSIAKLVMNQNQTQPSEGSLQHQTTHANAQCASGNDFRCNDQTEPELPQNSTTHINSQPALISSPMPPMPPPTSVDGRSSHDDGKQPGPLQNTTSRKPAISVEDRSTPNAPSSHTAVHQGRGPANPAAANANLSTNTAQNNRVDGRSRGGVGYSLSDTPLSTAPSSPKMTPRYAPTAGVSTPSGVATPSKTRATTLDIPGLTRSKVSPDGHIASRDVGSKLVIVMVGLPARGKSYITKKLARYLNWLQHDTRIFNVGERRRSAVGGRSPASAYEAPAKVDASLRESVADLHFHGQERNTASPTSEPGEGDVTPQDATNTERTAPAVPDGAADGSSSEAFPGHLSPSRPGRPSTQILVNGEPVDNLTEELTRDPSPMTDAFNSPAMRQTLDDVVHSDDQSKKPTGPMPPELPIPPPSPGMFEQKVQIGGEVPEPPNPNSSMDQSANFFDPENQHAVRLREQVALATLDELLDYILVQGGSIGIFDATNSTLSRRKAIMDRIRERAGPDLNVIFLESKCEDQKLIESNVRLKLSGPDYKGKDPAASLRDFKCRIDMYEKTYMPLGLYEEENNMPYVQTIDVSRKVVSHQVNGFLSSQVVYYLLNFNLSPRQIWISRHGESEDDVVGKIGGDSPLSENGIRYAKALSRFIAHQRASWESYQQAKKHSTHFPPEPGDTTPPNPRNSVQRVRGEKSSSSSSTDDEEFTPRNFCVWSSMLQRSMQTVQYFDDEEYDVKQMRMLDEINCGNLEGMTYEEIKDDHPQEYTQRKKQKLGYRYPGLGGESYLDVINRLRPVIVEVERMTDHVLLVSHRAVARVLLAYFRGLRREELAGLDVPLGVVYSIEPRPYGVDFKAYRYNPETDWFDWVPNFELRQSTF